MLLFWSFGVLKFFNKIKNGFQKDINQQLNQQLNQTVKPQEMLPELHQTAKAEIMILLIPSCLV